MPVVERNLGMIPRRRFVSVPWFVMGLGMLLTCLPARAAFDAYLLLPGIPGGATEPNHTNWIQILSFQQAVSHPVGAGSPRFATLTLGKQLDTASPLLLTACAGRQHLSSGRLQLLQSDGRRLVFFDIQLSNLLVEASVPSQSATNAHAAPTESLSLTFSNITWTYTAFGPRGLPSEVDQASWDLVHNTGVSNVTPAFSLTGVQRIPGSVTVSWNAFAGKTYQLLSSPVVQGPYSLAAQTNVPTADIASLTLGNPAPIQFYWMEESP